MTPQESELVGDLFDRLAKLESLPRDPAAERLIAAGRATRAARALRAGADGAAAGRGAQARQCPHRGIAGGVGRRRRAAAAARRLSRQHARRARPRRAARLGAERARGGRRRRTVARPRAGGGYPPQRAGYQPQMPPPGYGGGPAFGTGGSFLGTAASTAAGVLGGALLLDGIRSMFGQHFGGGTARKPSAMSPTIAARRGAAAPPTASSRVTPASITSIGPQPMRTENKTANRI